MLRVEQATAGHAVGLVEFVSGLASSLRLPRAGQVEVLVNSTSFDRPHTRSTNITCECGIYSLTDRQSKRSQCLRPTPSNTPRPNAFVVRVTCTTGHFTAEQ